MTGRPAPSLIRRAYGNMRPSWMAAEWLLCVAAGVAGAAWLQIPDSHIWQLLLSVVLAVLVIGVVLMVQVRILRDLRTPDGSSRAPLWQGAVSLLSLLFLWWFVLHLVDLGEAKIYLRAGYWNSRASADMRRVLTFDHLVRWQQWGWTLLECVLGGLLLGAGVEGATSRLGVAASRRVLYLWRRWSFWAVLLITVWVGASLTSGLMRWNPFHTVRGEIVSAVLRSGVAFTVDLLLACFVLGVAATHLADAELRYTTPAGTPEDSHPRTAAGP